MKLISSKPTIDVCIATYRRADRLRRLLESLLSQQTQRLFSYSLIVVDNDACRSAEPVVEKFLGMGPDLVYDVEPERNISLARNRCLTHATGDYIAMIDDDEYADGRWLLNLYTTMMAYEADVVRGPVVWTTSGNLAQIPKNLTLSTKTMCSHLMIHLEIRLFTVPVRQPWRN